MLVKGVPCKGAGVGSKGRNAALASVGRAPVPAAAPWRAPGNAVSLVSEMAPIPSKARSVIAKVASEATTSAGSGISITIDNNEDSQYTVLTVSAEGRSGLLTALTVSPIDACRMRACVLMLVRDS